MQEFNRKLLQVDSSATTVNAAPLGAANANANASSSALSSSTESNGTKPHAILTDVATAIQAKHNKTDMSVPAASMAAAIAASTATATANATADGGDDYYSTPCSSGPIPSQYEAFVQVSMPFHHVVH